jgi:hypothetical protein
MLRNKITSDVILLPLQPHPDRDIVYVPLRNEQQVPENPETVTVVSVHAVQTVGHETQQPQDKTI